MARGKGKSRKRKHEPGRTAAKRPAEPVSVTTSPSVTRSVGGGTSRHEVRSPVETPAAATARETTEVPETAIRHALGFLRVGRIDFIGRRRWYLIASGVLLLVSLLSLGLQGLNYGIDFSGGNAYSLRFTAPVQESEIRSAIESIGITGAIIRVDRTDPDEALLRTPYLDTEAEARMMSALHDRFGEIDAPSGDVVSPTIGGELLRDALIAVVLACLGILIYIAVRFEYRFAAAGVLGLIHDAVITIGIFSLLRLEINAAFVAAILTVIGYSINNTIVVFDRIRDNLKRRAKEGLESLANRSINETFVRSVNTSATAFLAIGAIFIFGGASTRDFALALMLGIAVGTYSSICVATPLWLLWRRRDELIAEAPQSRAMTARRSG